MLKVDIDEDAGQRYVISGYKSEHDKFRICRKKRRVKMPTYKNETSATIIYDNVTFPPGETVNTWVFVPREKGLTEVSPEPNRIGALSGCGELTIAANATKELYVPDCTKFMAK